MVQQQLNLSPEALTALLQVLSALNFNSNGDAALSASTTMTTGVTSPAPSTVPPASAGSNDIPAPSVTHGTPAPVVVSTVTATRPSSPVVARHPFTCAPLSQLALSLLMTASCSSTTAGPSSHSPPPAQVHSCFHCSHCSAFNPTVGQSGESWEQVQPFIFGVPHACHKKYCSCSEADTAFKTALAEGKQCMYPKTRNRTAHKESFCGVCMVLTFLVHINTLSFQPSIMLSTSYHHWSILMAVWGQPTGRMWREPGHY
ncbi:hypothetical protein EDD85DRAFT_794684 [Armillaria nabsnona]|nr:hypothetical protein EDD85DRAFT_794684 [Armillaria nabsnona]